jgi:hypothetical protein
MPIPMVSQMDMSVWREPLRLVLKGSHFDEQGQDLAL